MPDSPAPRSRGLEAAIALQRSGDAAAAQVLLDTGIGKRAMDEIRTAVDGMTLTHRRQLAEATNR